MAVKNTSGCVSDSSTSVTVTVNPSPTAPTVTPSSASTCGGATITYTATAGASSYAWTVLGGTVTGATNTNVLTVTAGATGSVSATAIAVNASGCSSLASAASVVSINPAAAAPTQIIVGQPAGTTTLNICTGGSYTLGFAGASAGDKYEYFVRTSTTFDSTTLAPGTAQQGFTAGATAGTFVYSVKLISGSCTSLISSTITVNVNLTPTITGLVADVASPCIGSVDTVRINPIPNATYSWTINGVAGVYGNAYKIPVNTSAAGDSSYAVTVAAGGCTTTLSSIVHVIILGASPAPVLSIVGQTGTTDTVCVGASVIIKASTGTGVTYTYSGQPIGSVVSGDQLTVGTATPGTYTITTIASATGSCSSAVSNSIVVVVKGGANPLTLAVTGSASVCQNAPSVVLTATPNRGPYIFVVGGVASAPQAANTFNASTAVAGTISYSVINAPKDSCQSVASNAVSVLVKKTTQTQALSANSGATSCFGAPIVLTALPGDSIYYFYVGTTRVVSTTNSYTYTPTTAGTYAFTAKSLDSSSCDTGLLSPIVSVTVLPEILAPAAPTVDVSSVCLNGVVTLTALPGFDSYSLNGGAPQQSNVFIVPTATAGTTAYTFVGTLGNCLSPVSAAVSVTVLPAADATVTNTGLNTCNGASVTLTASAGGASATYQWYKGGVAIASATGSAYTIASSAGNGTYTVVVTNAAGCTATSLDQVVTINDKLVVTLVSADDKLAAGQSGKILISSPGRKPSVKFVYVSKNLVNGRLLDSAISFTGVQTDVQKVVAVDTISGCISDTLYVKVRVNPQIFVPSIFSPASSDADLKTFKVYGYGLEEITLVIYDRNHIKVYETSDINEAQNIGWDGTANGKELPQDTYYYNISGKVNKHSITDQNGNNAGTINLLK